MPKKKKLTKEQRREARLRKGAQWLTTYQGTPKHMLKHYRERFHVDTITASKDLQALGVNYTQEQLDMIRRNEEERIRRKHEEKARKQEQMFEDLYGDTCDDYFAYIAGYTSGGAPYGTTWEEMGIDPSIPFSEKVRILGSGDFKPRDPDELDWYEESEEDAPLQLQVIPETFSICQVENYQGIDIDQPFVFTGRTDDENSLPDLGGHVGDLLVHGVEHPLKVVHDAVHQHSLKPVSDLVKNRLHAYLLKAIVN